MNARRVYSAKVDRASGIICDQAIALNGHYVAQDYPEHLRRIRLKDPETQKTLVFFAAQAGTYALMLDICDRHALTCSSENLGNTGASDS
jgi:hypothetical protein